MPIYEYECTSCCTVFEVFQRMTESPLANCPDCSGSVKKLVSMSSFQLKGGGWYADGYSNKSANVSGSTSSEKSKDGTSGKTDKKPDSSSDSTAGNKPKAACSTTS